MMYFLVSLNNESWDITWSHQLFKKGQTPDHFKHYPDGDTVKSCQLSMIEIKEFYFYPLQKYLRPFSLHSTIVDEYTGQLTSSDHCIPSTLYYPTSYCSIFVNKPCSKVCNLFTLMHNLLLSVQRKTFAPLCTTHKHLEQFNSSHSS